MVQGLGLAKKYLEKIKYGYNEVKKVEENKKEKNLSELRNNRERFNYKV